MRGARKIRMTGPPAGPSPRPIPHFATMAGAHKKGVAHLTGQRLRSNGPRRQSSLAIVVEAGPELDRLNSREHPAWRPRVLSSRLKRSSATCEFGDRSAHPKSEGQRKGTELVARSHLRHPADWPNADSGAVQVAAAEAQEARQETKKRQWIPLAF